MARRRVAGSATLLMAVFVTGAVDQNPGEKRAQVHARLQASLNAEVAAHKSLPGELLLVRWPQGQIDVTLAAGVAERESGLPLTPAHVFRVASVTKTFTAASILRLAEDGRFAVTDAVDKHLSPGSTGALKAGGYDPAVITIQQLLTHTSGLFDYATSPSFQAEALGNPRRRWSRQQQLEFAMTAGKPRFAPGQGYHYSDTGYILLAEIIERVSGQALGTAYRTLLRFGELKLQHTYLETLESAPADGQVAHAYFGDVDTAGFDPSFDLYGGGGLMSRVDDLARFYRGLFTGSVFRRRETLEQMLTIPPTNRASPGGPYASGIARRTIAGQACWGHTGFWGTSAYHCPDIDLTIVRHYGQAQPEPVFQFDRLYEQIAEILGLRPVR